jgi:hypothetical protein
MDIEESFVKQVIDLLNQPLDVHNNGFCRLTLGASNQTKINIKVKAKLLKGINSPILPKPCESIAISFGAPKTAALAFDRVYRLPIVGDTLVPKEVGFYFATTEEIAFNIYMLNMAVTNNVVIDVDGLKLQESNNVKVFHSSANYERGNMQLLTAHFPTPASVFYQNQKMLSAAYPSGSSEVLHAAITDVALVREDELSWEQVLEFRRDDKARTKYRRFVRWVDMELKSSSPKEVVELMSIRLDDYEWALKKHGIKTSLGALSCLLDPKFLTTASAAIAVSAIAGGKLWASLASAGLVIGRSALEFGTQFVDAKDALRKENYELAYVHEVSKLFG